MQGFNRKKRKNNNNYDSSICQEDGIYCPTFNPLHMQSIKADQPFPLYHGKIVRWVLVDKKILRNLSHAKT